MLNTSCLEANGSSSISCSASRLNDATLSIWRTICYQRCCKPYGRQLSSLDIKVLFPVKAPLKAIIYNTKAARIRKVKR